ncbi:ankyrin repeat domain-containing protein 63-like [Triticum dicoccoides]|uniref:ankyrin repeat domain-containing protein 63-like n=1 Tax=Triticum dicoccoides TaxID=85692 RepID=UPI00188F3292|nr:ankyrin repeat domain-containing protein 63-like [Triticum dicoccoides]
MPRQGHFRHFAYGCIKSSRSGGGNLPFRSSRTRAAPLSSFSRPHPSPFCPDRAPLLSLPTAPASPAAAAPPPPGQPPPATSPLLFLEEKGREEKRKSERVRRREGKRRWRASGSGDGHGHGARRSAGPVVAAALAGSVSSELLLQMIFGPHGFYKDQKRFFQQHLLSPSEGGRCKRQLLT